MCLTQIPRYRSFHPTLIGENVKVTGFDSSTHTHTHLYLYVHTLLPCCVVAFFILSQRTIRGDITASITPATTQPSPHSPHNQLPKTIVSMVTGRHSLGAPRYGLHEQHADENLPKAPASHSAGAQPEQAKTPLAGHRPGRATTCCTRIHDLWEGKC